MAQIRRALATLLAAIIFATGCAIPISASAAETAYILTPPQPPQAPVTKHEFVNILLLGIDYGIFTIGDGKEAIEKCHTDSIIMVAVDKTDLRISLISIPRDTITYVPGAYGVYKLNAAFNCSESVEEGLESTRNTVSWLLGGIRPDHYLLITPTLVERICDSIGGLDVDVEMRYIGTSGTLYERGLQHLDGEGLMDYVRARRNATKNDNDYGRTARQRAVLSALFKRVNEDPDVIFDVLDTLVENFGEYFFSDLSVADLWDMLPLAETMAEGSIASYEMTGELEMSMKYFNSSYFDQEKRQSIIREVYGVSIPKQRLNSHGYMNYLFQHGFSTIKAIRVSRRIIDWAKAHGYTGDKLAPAEETLAAAIESLSAMDDSLEQATADKTTKLTDILRERAAALATAAGYPDLLTWKITDTDHWYQDPDINQYYQIDWR